MDHESADARGRTSAHGRTGRADARLHMAVADLTGPLESAWAELADRVAAPPSLHPGYLLTWSAAHAPGRRVRLVTAHRGDELVAVLPLVMTRTGLSTLPPRDLEENGIVAAEEDVDAAAAVGRHALTLRVARLVLRPVLRDGPTHVAVARAAGRPPVETRMIDEHPQVDIRSDWDEYWRSRSGKTRNDVTRNRRRLVEAGEVSVRVVDGTTDLDRLLDIAFEIEASGWKGRSGTALAVQPAAERFHRDLARWAAARGWFRLALLELDGRPIAFHYSLQAHGVLYALKIGYRDDLKRFSPGTVLMASEIERAFAEGLSRFDFAGSAAGYKTRWATGSRELLELSVFPPTPLGRAGHLQTRARSRLLPLAKDARAHLRRILRR